MDVPAPRPPEPPPDLPETRVGLGRLAVAVATLLVLVAATYLVPPLHRFQPWRPGDGLPIARLFTTDDEEAPSTVAGGGLAPDTPEDALRRIAHELGDDVAANLGEEAGLEPAPPTQRTPPSAHGQVRVDPSELAGLAREIEDPTGHALDRFYASLLATARREHGAITRIAHYGDSSIASDRLTYTVRRRM